MIARANGHRGIKRLATAIAGDPQWTRSELERRMRKLARDHKLPQAAEQPHPRRPRPPGPGRRTSTSRPTASFVETDGWDGPPAPRCAFENDRAKDAALTAAGCTVMRFTWRQLRDDPNTVAERLGAVMRPAPAPLP